MKFVLFKNSLKEGAAPIYLFDGEEEYFKERGEEMLKERFLGEPSLNYSAFHGEALKGAALSSLVAAAQSFPFMSEKRIVRVTDFYPTEKEYETYLKGYFENPSADTVLLIVNSSRPKGKFDLKKMPNVTYVDCGKADEETVLRWIYTQFRRAGVRADTDCCERVTHYCLGDMSRIAGETEKLIAYAGQGGAVSPEDVDAVVYKDAEYKTYEMTGAFGAGNYAKFLSVQRELMEKGADEGAVLNALCAYLRSLLEILLLKKSDAETARALGMNEYAVKMSRRQANAVGAARVRACWEYVYAAISGVRSGELTAPAALLKVNAQLFYGEDANMPR